ncbi:MAG: hypothetical protein HYW80_01840 [Parcubacteria group bacterium]|nr:hypothetical protein [Parcubacteria group bacterium]
MNNKKHTIHDLLADWGRNERQSPVRNEVLKSEVLSKLASAAPRVEKVPRRIPWLPFTFASLAVLTFLLNSVRIGDIIIVKKSLAPETREGSGGFAVPERFPWPKTESPISDTREFLKTDYHATVRTRHIEELTQRIQITVHGFGGRVDGTNSSEQFGYVSFAVPAHRFEAFRAEVKNLARAKFYTEEVRTENLLPQKQAIEENQQMIEKALSALQEQRQQLIKDHNRIVASIKSQLNKIAAEETLLQAEVTSDPVRQAQIAARLQELSEQKRSLENQLAAENSNYVSKLGSLDSQIRDAELQLEAITKQDQNLLDTVATVRGTISLSWISIWEIIDLYLPGPLISWILFGVAAAAYLWHRRRSEILIP